MIGLSNRNRLIRIYKLEYVLNQFNSNLRENSERRETFAWAIFPFETASNNISIEILWMDFYLKKKHNLNNQSERQMVSSVKFREIDFLYF